MLILFAPIVMALASNELNDDASRQALAHRAGIGSVAHSAGFDAGERVVVPPDAVVPAHVMTETYAVLTRMPEPFRMDAAPVAEYLARQWDGRVIVPDAELYESLIATAAHAGVTGGGTYDALVGLTAHRFGRELLSLDLRAERTYRTLGISYRLLVQ